MYQSHLQFYYNTLCSYLNKLENHQRKFDNHESSNILCVFEINPSEVVSPKQLHGKLNQNREGGSDRTSSGTTRQDVS